MRRLKKAGFQAHLVGGGVRDLLLGKDPKDFDVATDASPEEVDETFRNCRLIGRRFRLAHVHFGREIIEVATFRGHHTEKSAISEHSQKSAISEHSDGGMILRDNVFGSIEEDAIRRDFTVNALFYNIADFSVIDYVGGIEDLNNRTLRLIGDPETRYREDPVRMIRAIRFAAKLGFKIHPDSEAPIFELGNLLDDIPSARLYEEILKLFLGQHAVDTFEKLRHYDLLKHLFPSTEESFQQEALDFPKKMVMQGLENTDLRLRSGKHITPAFLFAVLLWESVRKLSEKFVSDGSIPQTAMYNAADQVLSQQVKKIAIPRRYTSQMKEIWNLQFRLERSKSAKRARRLVENPRFRAAYDFLLLRSESGEIDNKLANFWTKYQEDNPMPIHTKKKFVAKKKSNHHRKKSSSRKKAG